MAMVKKYPAEVLAVKQPIENVYSVDMKTTGRSFKYYPGQFLHLALDEYDPGSGWPESRCFSMQTPPGSDLLRITYAVKGSFTTRMASELVPGKQVTLKLPYGDLFIQDHNKETAIFIAGGTGITPFLSLFNDNSFKTYSRSVLFAGFRNRSMNLYQDELSEAAKINPSFKTRYYYEDGNGLINIDDVLNESGNDRTYFISGPLAMIAFFRQSLQTNGINPSQIKTDDWE